MSATICESVSCEQGHPLLAARHLLRRLYAREISSVMENYALTRVDLEVLLYLASHPGEDTAAEIVNRCSLTKSHVSGAVEHLTDLGLLAQCRDSRNRRRVHLSLTGKAAPMVADGLAAQRRFLEVLTRHLGDEEKQQLLQLMSRMLKYAVQEDEDTARAFGLPLMDALVCYTPCCPQEEADREEMLKALVTLPAPFSRMSRSAHFSASAWIVNPARDRVLMVYHNLYDSWSWTGGHADGETDLLAVALREAREETGLETIRPLQEDIYSLEVLNVEGHEKCGQYVPSHLHLNVTYLLEADDTQPLRIKPDENSGVRWFTLAESLEKPSEKWMVERVYRKLNEKLGQAVK